MLPEPRLAALSGLGGLLFEGLKHGVRDREGLHPGREPGEGGGGNLGGFLGFLGGVLGVGKGDFEAANGPEEGFELGVLLGIGRELGAQDLAILGVGLEVLQEGCPVGLEAVDVGDLCSSTGKVNTHI